MLIHMYMCCKAVLIIIIILIIITIKCSIFHKKGEARKYQARAKHPVKVYTWGRISKHGATPHVPMVVPPQPFTPCTNPVLNTPITIPENIHHHSLHVPTLCHQTHFNLSPHAPTLY